MITEDKLFGNFFDDKNIINRRMYNFSLDTLNRLTVANGGGDYTTLLNLLSPLIVTFGTEIGDVDAALNLQKGKNPHCRPGDCRLPPGAQRKARCHRQ